ncbi:uncharacterized protein LOC121739535 [Aricia agestis]|uniref:uncharacterized protein LOC121739535 n=1 Tax=Aricia agestis TaxID=91739 RepID=UPI001C20A0E8|nr:uncharacterized protein LOC121739535 [Aricia agestis]
MMKIVILIFALVAIAAAKPGLAAYVAPAASYVAAPYVAAPYVAAAAPYVAAPAVVAV